MSSMSGSKSWPAREPSSVVKEKNMGCEEDRLDAPVCCLLRNWEAYAAKEVAIVVVVFVVRLRRR
jgi:hypothetical protein